jgi:zinc/manganese transport system substrate-binding protein
LLSGRIAGLLVTNLQVSDLATEQLRTIAEANNIPVVALSELIPETDMDYLDWMARVLDHLQEAVY